jgi:hypothetical protein
MEDTLEKIKEWEKIINSNEKKFIHKFCKKYDTMMLGGIYWNSENMSVHYILFSGRHISDSFKIKEWEEFLKSIGEL